MRLQIWTVLTALFLTGCSATKPTTHNAFGTDVTGLEQVEESTLADLYIDPTQKLTPFRKIMLEPVSIYYDEGAEVTPYDSFELEYLRLFFEAAVYNALKDGYELTPYNGFDTAKLRVALTNVQVVKNHPNATPSEMDFTISTPSIEIHAEVLNSMTNKLYGVVIDRYEDHKIKLLPSTINKWKDAEGAFSTYAQFLRTKLDMLNGRIPAE